MRFPTHSTLLALVVLFVAPTHAAAEDQVCNPITEYLTTENTAACAKPAPVSEGEGTPDEDVQDDDNKRGSSGPIPSAIWKAMQGKSWHRKLKCPVRKRLSLLEIPYWDFDYERKMGRLIVARDSATKILDVFETLYDAGFPIARMDLVHTFGGSDDRSMAANNTSAFNCRSTTSGRRLSEHSYGRAIDINPIQNPYVTGRGRVVPPAGRAFKSNRKRKRRGMIQRGDAVVKAFRKIGWKWGGDWRSVKDYQHFSKTGR